MDTAVTDTTPARPKPRDWIAVDQLVQRLINTAADDFDRDVLRLAAETSGGPDPDTIGGGADWQEALSKARADLQAVANTDLDAHRPEPGDDSAVLADIQNAVAHADLNDFDRDRLVEGLADLFTVQLRRARSEERTTIANWLDARAGRLGDDGSVIVEAQARALGAAAQRLRATITTP